MVAMGRRHRKRIQALRVGARVVKGPRAVKKEAVHFFKKLYTQQKMPEVDILDDFLPRITEELVVSLEYMPAIQEIKEAVWSC